MAHTNYDTLSEATNALTEAGYTESFRAEENHIIASGSKKKYLPNELEIIRTYRFEGMTNPQDSTAVFALKAQDGTKGTLVMSYGAKHNQNTELIRRIPNVQ